MTKSLYCQIRVKGHLSSQWDDWFGWLDIDNQPNGEAVLSGPLPDQAALYGVLEQVRNLGLCLIALNCSDSAAKDWQRFEHCQSSKH